MAKKEQTPRVTIDDVARLCDVSKTTVSRYINGKHHMMSAEVAQKIEEVIHELGYRPSRIAQNLKSKHTTVIGCVIADITSEFSASLVKGISDICFKNDYQVLFANTNNDPQKEVETIKSLLDSKVDGLIVNTAGSNDDFLISIRDENIPIVIADRYLDGEIKIDTISSTNYQSTYDTLCFLKKQGYEQVYFFGQTFGLNNNRVIRHQAFLDAKHELFNHDGASNTYLITNRHDDSDLDNMLIEIKEKHPDESVALFAVNEMMLLALVKSLRRNNYLIGIDFGICGYDDSRWTELVDPGITTIRQDTFKLGSTTAQRLLQLIKSNRNLLPKLVELPTTLMKRGSTTIISKD